MAERGEHIPTPTLGAILGFIPKTIFTQVVYAIALYKATVRKRLAVYREQTAPVIDRYRTHGARLIAIDAVRVRQLRVG